MSPEILEKLRKVFFRNCAENVSLWKKMGIKPEDADKESLKETAGYRAYLKITNNPTKTGGSYESHWRAIRSADLHLTKMGYRCVTINSPTSSTICVLVTNARPVRLWVRVPKELVMKIVVLGVVPNISHQIIEKT